MSNSFETAIGVLLAWSHPALIVELFASPIFQAGTLWKLSGMEGGRQQVRDFNRLQSVPTGRFQQIGSETLNHLETSKKSGAQSAEPVFPHGNWQKNLPHWITLPEPAYGRSMYLIGIRLKKFGRNPSS